MGVYSYYICAIGLHHSTKEIRYSFLERHKKLIGGKMICNACQKEIKEEPISLLVQMPHPDSNYTIEFHAECFEIVDHEIRGSLSREGCQD